MLSSSERGGVRRRRVRREGDQGEEGDREVRGSPNRRVKRGMRAGAA